MEIRHPLGHNLGPQFTGDLKADNSWHNTQRPSSVVSSAKPEMGMQEANSGEDDLSGLLGLAMHEGGQSLYGQRLLLNPN